MNDIILNRKSASNILDMLTSKDKENTYVALQSLENCNIEQSLPYILLLYKFGGMSEVEWKDAPNCLNAMKIHMYDTEKVKLSFSASELMKALLKFPASVECMEMFLTVHHDSLVGILGQWGYPIETLELLVKYKENELEKRGIISEDQ
jgi:hypothetical protein